MKSTLNRGVQTNCPQIAIWSSAANATTQKITKQIMSSKNQSILVIGGAGYIGTHLCKQLVKNGYVPVVVDRNIKNKHI